jgi:hypothetical protein
VVWTYHCDECEHVWSTATRRLLQSTVCAETPSRFTAQKLLIGS